MARWGMWLAVAGVFFLGCGPADAAQGTRHRAVGRKLPTVAVQSLTEGSPSATLSDLQGKVVVLHFWGGWCADCVREFPAISALEQKYREHEHVSFLPIYSSAETVEPDLNDLRDEAEAFLQTRKSDMPNVADVQDRTRTAVERTVGWQGYPCTVVLDGEGVIRGAWLYHNANSTAEIDTLVESLLPQ